ncbi:MAG TPA: DAK2 domain-containing protein, partial [Actinomycetota bacterium]|nr:DAK2 domain-containing protein [Actinomycetota bacterium]
MGATLSARALRRAMGELREALRAHRDELDSLNVFPVPDGDTGTNLLLTQEAVVDALKEVAADDPAAVSEAVTLAALMSARGNSGVILSQILRGLCEGLSRSDDLASALQAASQRARQAVAEPVEGTMLTVLRDAAAAARGVGDGSDGAAQAAEAALREGLAALERTRDQLPPLREAGVVDAGGRGVVLLLDSVAAVIRNAPRTVEVGPGGPIGRRSDRAPAPTRYGYEAMYLLECEEGALSRLRQRLAAIGDSVAVVGAAGLFNVHVHTDDPGGAVEAGLDAGRPREIRIASLDEQVARSCVAREARAVRVPEVRGAVPATAEVGMVAVAPGPGLADLFRSLGATAVSDV